MESFIVRGLGVYKGWKCIEDMIIIIIIIIGDWVGD